MSFVADENRAFDEEENSGAFEEEEETNRALANDKGEGENGSTEYMPQSVSMTSVQKLSLIGTLIKMIHMACKQLQTG